MRAVALAALLLAAPAPARAAGFSLEDVMSAPFAHVLTAADSVPRAAWALDLRGEHNVWVAEGPAYKPRQLTRYAGDTGQPIEEIALARDGKTVVFVRGPGGFEASNANPTSVLAPPKQEVYSVPFDGGEPKALGCDGGCDAVAISPDGKQVAWIAKKQLWLAPIDGSAPAKQITQVQGVVHDPRWSPDSRSVAFSVDRKSHSLIAILDLGAPALRWIAPSLDRDALPRWSPDGKQLAFVRAAGLEHERPIIPIVAQPFAIWAADAKTLQAHEVWRSGNGLRDSLPEFFESAFFDFLANQTILFASEKDNRNHLYAVPAAGGAARLLTPGDFDVEQVAVAPDRQTLYYTSNQDDIDRRHVWRVRADGGAAPQAVTRGAGIETSPAPLADGTVLVLAATATQPTLPARVKGAGLEGLAAGAVPREFPAAQLVTPRQVTFKAADGITIHGQLFAAPSCKTGCPGIVFLHGGPIRQMVLGWHYMGYYANAYAMNQFLASKGYVVLSVNYRLGIMYGRDFREAPEGCWRGAAEYQDVVAAAQLLQSLPQVDKGRIGLWGGSYGGYLTALGLARSSDLFKAGVDFHGVHDWSLFLSDWTEDAEHAPDLKAAKELAFHASPVADVARWKSPVLLIHADDDHNVPFDQSTDLAQKLKRQGVRFEQLIFPDDIHGFLLWGHWVTAYRATAAFFDRELRGR
jgi:dipeptidyl aminopeptidase/acylaminoacyl peptidase